MSTRTPCTLDFRALSFNTHAHYHHQQTAGHHHHQQQPGCSNGSGSCGEAGSDGGEQPGKAAIQSAFDEEVYDDEAWLQISRMEELALAQGQQPPGQLQPPLSLPHHVREEEQEVADIEEIGLALDRMSLYRWVGREVCRVCDFNLIAICAMCILSYDHNPHHHHTTIIRSSPSHTTCQRVKPPLQCSSLPWSVPPSSMCIFGMHWDWQQASFACTGMHACDLQLRANMHVLMLLM
jgi:hypothetical protein